MPVMLLVTGTRTASLAQRFGERLTLVAAVVLCSMSWLLVAVAHTSPWEIALSAGLCGAGNGIALAVLPILVTANVPVSQTGAANGLNNLTRLLGGAVGGQVAATLLAGTAVHGLPSDHGYTVAFVLGAATLMLAFLPAFAIPRRGAAAAVAGR
jgi:MFS family permease